MRSTVPGKVSTCPPLRRMSPENASSAISSKKSPDTVLPKHIRELMVFAPQNLIMDPPFTKLDLVSCRNMLIYLTGELQKKLLPLFHYTLNPGGLLFLGSSETIGAFQDLFTPVNSKWRIFKRKESSRAKAAFVEMPSGLLPRFQRSGQRAEGPRAATDSVAELSRQMLLGRFVP